GWDDFEELASESSLPLLVKGVITAEDAALACEHGAAGIVVSNHGGRQLDGVPATIDALPEVVEAVDGRVEVLVDGGVRRGADVARALALGARAVLEILREEIELALVLLGCPTPGDVTRSHVMRRPVT